MTDITDQDLCKALAWAEGSMARGGADAAARVILATVDAPPPSLMDRMLDWWTHHHEDPVAFSTLAESVDQMEHDLAEARAEVARMNSARIQPYGEGSTLAGFLQKCVNIARNIAAEYPSRPVKDHVIDLRWAADYAEQIEQERDHALAEVERLTAEWDDRPAADLPDPADVPYGQTWIVEYHGDHVPALRRLEHPGDWYLVRKNGTGGHVRSQDITLVSRLVPAPRQITTREILDEAPRRTVIRDKDGVVCERASLGDGWYSPESTTDQTDYIKYPATVLWTPEVPA